MLSSDVRCSLLLTSVYSFEAPQEKRPKRRKRIDPNTILNGAATASASGVAPAAANGVMPNAPTTVTPAAPDNIGIAGNDTVASNAPALSATTATPESSVIRSARFFCILVLGHFLKRAFLAPMWEQGMQPYDSFYYGRHPMREMQNAA